MGQRSAFVLVMFFVVGRCAGAHWALPSYGTSHFCLKTIQLACFFLWGTISVVDLFARIELGGYPTEEAYRELDQFMAALNWYREAHARPLPHATYIARFDGEESLLIRMANTLKSGIQAKVWPSATVLIIRAADWATSEVQTNPRGQKPSFRFQAER